ncbi:MAG: hypothetical protein U0Q03_05160 [Acidimicrobiales bacterium]
MDTVDHLGDGTPGGDEPLERLSLLAVVEGESWVRPAVVVRRDAQEVHVSTDEVVPLPVGQVVGLMCHATVALPAVVNLAVVSDSLGPTVTALRLIERRR